MGCQVQSVSKQLYHKLANLQQQLGATIEAVGAASHHQFWTANLQAPRSVLAFIVMAAFATCC